MHKKIELSSKFGVNPTFNISDLKPYMREEHELELSMTPFHDGEDDGDITLSDATIATPPKSSHNST